MQNCVTDAVVVVFYLNMNIMKMEYALNVMEKV